MDKRYTDVRKLTDNPFLNLYEMDALTAGGDSFHYYFATRKKENELQLRTKESRADGIVIYPVLKEDPGKLVMIRQYRYPLDTWLYELPAGLIDEGETPAETAVREMKEETGMDFEVYEGGDDAFRKGYFLGAGMTDEINCAVYGYASGDVSALHQESTESIEVLTVDREEARRILRQEPISLRGAYLLMQFIHADPGRPFEFLD